MDKLDKIEPLDQTGILDETQKLHKTAKLPSKVAGGKIRLLEFLFATE